MIFGIAFLLFAVAYAGRTVKNARNEPWAGPQTKGMRQRGQQNLQANGGRPRSLRQDIRMLREQTLHTDWLEQRRHDRSSGTSSATATPVSPKRQTIRGFAQKVTGGGVGADGRLRPDGERFGSMSDPDFQRLLNDRQKAGLGPLRPAKTGGGSSPGAAPPNRNGNGQRNGWSPRNIRPAPGRPAPPPPPPRQASQTSQTSTSSGGTSTMASGSSSGGVEKLIEGIQQIHAEALAGNIHAKQRALKAATEGCLRFAQTAVMLSRSMSEPGNNYGPEITEPIAKSGEQLQASAMLFGEADTNLTTLINMSVGDLATSSRQAPHHTELSENGSR